MICVPIKVQKHCLSHNTGLSLAGIYSPEIVEHIHKDIYIDIQQIYIFAMDILYLYLKYIKIYICNSKLETAKMSTSRAQINKS